MEGDGIVCRAARRRRGPQALQRELPQVGSARPSFHSRSSSSSDGQALSVAGHC